MIQGLIAVHVGSGAAWLVISSVTLVRRATDRWTIALQALASLTTLLAGILLWHALHAGGMGPAERVLVIGTFFAFVALGLQIGVLATGRRGRLSAGAFVLHAVSVGFLAGAAIAMVASRFVG